MTANVTIIEHSGGIPNPGPPNSQWITCPVDGCTSAFDVTPDPVDPSTLAAVFGVGVFSAVASHERHERIEEYLHNHLSAHSVVEWAKTVQALQRENDELRRRVDEL